LALIMRPTSAGETFLPVQPKPLPAGCRTAVSWRA
jgi:hypothetical protein